MITHAYEVVAQTLRFAFWRTAYSAYRLLQGAFLQLVTKDWIRRTVTAKMDSMGICVHVDGEPKPAGKYRAVIQAHSVDFFYRTARDGGLGESYMSSLWDSPDLIAVATCLASHPLGVSDFPLYMQDQLARARNRQHKGKEAHRVMDVHYNLGNDLYEKMLGPTMNYTCAYFSEGIKTLEDAEIAKMDLVARKLKLKPGMKVLELGCGFGAMMKYLAEKYGVSCTGYTLSKEQVIYGREHCKGLDVTIHHDDIRNAKGLYDRVYSIGLFEHVGSYNYRGYYELVGRLLKDDGLHLSHAITMRDSKCPRTGGWMVKYIFPGGEIPFPEDYITNSAGLFCLEDMHNVGYSYVNTLKSWLANFEKAWPELEATYGPQVQGRFYRMWRYYLCISAGCFEARLTQIYQVVQHKKGCPRWIC